LPLLANHLYQEFHHPIKKNINGSDENISEIIKVFLGSNENPLKEDIHNLKKQNRLHKHQNQAWIIQHRNKFGILKFDQSLLYHI
jgi:hypothetical protein